MKIRSKEEILREEYLEDQKAMARVRKDNVLNEIIAILENKMLNLKSKDTIEKLKTIHHLIEKTIYRTKGK